MKITRGKFLKLGAMAGAGFALPLGELSDPAVRMAASAIVMSPRVEAFRVPLAVTSGLKAAAYGRNTDFFEIAEKVEKQEILPGFKTDVWGYESNLPGSTIEARS